MRLLFGIRDEPSALHAFRGVTSMSSLASCWHLSAVRLEFCLATSSIRPHLRPFFQGNWGTSWPSNPRGETRGGQLWKPGRLGSQHLLLMRACRRFGASSTLKTEIEVRFNGDRSDRHTSNWSIVILTATSRVAMRCVESTTPKAIGGKLLEMFALVAAEA